MRRLNRFDCPENKCLYEYKARVQLTQRASEPVMLRYIPGKSFLSIISERFKTVYTLAYTVAATI